MRHNDCRERGRGGGGGGGVITNDALICRKIIEL